jgi:hypothetical protein
MFVPTESYAVVTNSVRKMARAEPKTVTHVTQKRSARVVEARVVAIDDMRAASGAITGRSSRARSATRERAIERR